MAGGTPFEQALGRAWEIEGRITRQRTLIARLEELGEVQILPEAYRLLAMMEANRRLFSAQLRTVFDLPLRRRGL